MIILTFSSHYAKRLNFSAHFAFFSPSFLLVCKSSKMAEWAALRWAGRPPGQSWGTPAGSTCRSGPRQCRQFHRFLREFEICLATREIFFTFFHHIIVSKNVVCPAEGVIVSLSLSANFMSTSPSTSFLVCFAYYADGIHQVLNID